VCRRHGGVPLLRGQRGRIRAGLRVLRTVLPFCYEVDRRGTHVRISALSLLFLATGRVSALRYVLWLLCAPAPSSVVKSVACAASYIYRAVSCDHIGNSGLQYSPPASVVSSSHSSLFDDHKPPCLQLLEILEFY